MSPVADRKATPHVFSQKITFPDELENRLCRPRKWPETNHFLIHLGILRRVGQFCFVVVTSDPPCSVLWAGVLHGSRAVYVQVWPAATHCEARLWAWLLDSGRTGERVLRFVERDRGDQGRSGRLTFQRLWGAILWTSFLARARSSRKASLTRCPPPVLLTPLTRFVQAHGSEPHAPAQL